jgi:hypothetical protein
MATACANEIFRARWKVTYVVATRNCESHMAICTAGRYSEVLRDTPTTSVQRHHARRWNAGGELRRRCTSVARGRAANIRTVTAGTGAYAGATAFFSFLAVADGGGAARSCRRETRLDSNRPIKQRVPEVTSICRA